MRKAIITLAAITRTLAMAARKIDPVYPGTAVARLEAVHQRLAAIPQSELDGPWPDARRALLRAGGLRDLPNARPGQGYTGHAFNDYNHCDLTTMLGDVQDESNADGSVAEISRSNLLGPGIREASLPELGEGGSWSTCTNGCASEPPRDVAHVQFKSSNSTLTGTPVGGYCKYNINQTTRRRTRCTCTCLPSSCHGGSPPRSASRRTQSARQPPSPQKGLFRPSS